MKVERVTGLERLMKHTLLPTLLRIYHYILTEEEFLAEMGNRTTKEFNITWVAGYAIYEFKATGEIFAVVGTLKEKRIFLRMLDTRSEGSPHKGQQVRSEDRRTFQHGKFRYNAVKI